MYEYLEIPVRLLNGIVTLGISLYLFRAYQNTEKRFYMLWGIGFLLYGINIIIRLGTVPTIGQWLPAFLLLGGFISIIRGLAELVERKRLIYVVFILPITMVGLYLSPYPENYLIEALGWVTSIMPYLLITMSLLYIRINYSPIIDLQLVGWVNLLLVNIAFPLDMMDIVYIDFMAVFGKLIIFAGMLNPGFTMLIDDLKLFMISGMPSVYQDDVMGKFSLLNSKTGNRPREIEWITRRVEDNALKGISTILVSTYDLISQSDITSRELSEKVFIVRMVPGGRGAYNVMEDRVMTIDDDINQLDILFTDIIRYSNDRRINSEIIVFTLSNLLHTHGWKRVYTFLISKITAIRGSQVQVVSFYYPDSHDTSDDIVKFETIADNIIELS